MQTPTVLDQKSAEQLRNKKSIPRFSKTDSRYWLTRVYRPRNSRGAQSPHFAFQVQFHGHHLTFGLHTANRQLAAQKASRIFRDLSVLDVEKALAKHRPKQPEAEQVSSIGEYLEAARSVMDVRPRSFTSYANSLCLIAAAILYPEDKTRRRTRKINEGVGAAPLSIFTLKALQTWRLAFVARAQGDARRERAARISANAIIAQAKSLFSPRVVKFLGSLQLPDPLPLAGIERFPRESQRYISHIDAGELLRSARVELAVKAPAAFLTILLALAGGLRRAEIDQLQWANINLDSGRILIDSESGRLKTVESHGEVDIDERTVEILRGYRARATGKFVIEDPRISKSHGARGRYRCEETFAFVVWWLRRHGVNAEKPLHTLRKESGALVVSREGIYAASRHLRHRDIAVTSAHYADKKSRTVIDVAGLLKGDEGGPSNIVSMPEAEPTSAAKKPKRTRRKIL